MFNFLKNLKQKEKTKFVILEKKVSSLPNKFSLIRKDNIFQYYKPLKEIKARHMTELNVDYYNVIINESNGKHYLYTPNGLYEIN